MEPYPENHYSSGTICNDMNHNRNYQEVVKDCIYFLLALHAWSGKSKAKNDYGDLYESRKT